MKQFRQYEEYPYFDMRRCDYGCNNNPPIKPCYPNFNNYCDCFIPKPCNLQKPNCNYIDNCNNNNLMYLLVGIFIGKTLD